MIDSVVKLAQ